MTTKGHTEEDVLHMCPGLKLLLLGSELHVLETSSEEPENVGSPVLEWLTCDHKLFSPLGCI